MLRLMMVVLLALAAAGCDRYAVSTSSATGSGAVSGSTTSVSGNEIALSGTSGHAELAGDKIDIKEGSVFVNGISFGPVPATAEVKYAVNADARVLTVGGERRGAVK